MEIFGGFMVMMSILGLFLAVIWLIMPFVVLAMKGKQDRSLEVLDSLDKRLATIEELLKGIQSKQDASPVIPVSKSDSGFPVPE
jgi:flagellar biogenesis protein FliO